MSTPTNRPYQSRLFNFLNRQVQRVKENTDRTVRYIKMVTEWGVQIVLYPVYLTVQSARFAGYQLQQTAQQTWRQLQASKPSEAETPPDADIPIHEVLTVVDEIMLKEANPLAASAEGAEEVKNRYSSGENGLTPESARAQPLQRASRLSPKLQRSTKMIRGVASVLTTRTLVLVTADNQILDMLTPQQQQRLMQRIYGEVANYKRQRRLVQKSHWQFTERVPMPTKDGYNILPPIRVFWQVMAWVQTSPVARATNLFGESRLIKNPELQPEADYSEIIYLNNIPSSLTLLDRQIAELEAHPLESMSQLTNTITHRTQGLLQRQTKSSQSIEAIQAKNLSATTDTSPTESLGTYALIRAAIDYFFGSRRDRGQSAQAISGEVSENTNQLSGKQTTSLPSGVTVYAELPEAKPENSWLTWSDLFPNSTAPRQQPPCPPVVASATPCPPVVERIENTNPSLPGKTDVAAPDPILNFLKRLLTPRQDSSQRTQPRDTPELVEHQAREHIVLKSQIRITPTSPDANLEHAPDWIETKATPTGYVKHPLEQLMSWLDRWMLWIEQMMEKLLQWISLRN